MFGALINDLPVNGSELIPFTINPQNNYQDNDGVHVQLIE